MEIFDAPAKEPNQLPTCGGRSTRQEVTRYTEVCDGQMNCDKQQHKASIFFYKFCSPLQFYDYGMLHIQRQSGMSEEREKDSIASSCSPFVVVAFRYGGNENQFPIGVFPNRYSAEIAAKEHRNYRGGKYSHRIYQFDSIGRWDDDVAQAVNSKPCIEESQL